MKRTDPRTQFSKRLARWTAVFWFAYMLWLSIILIIEPQTALYSVYMGITVTIVMMLNVWAYTKNSTYEKAILAMLDKTRLEMSLKGSSHTTISKDEVYDDEGSEG